jgi:hypothetical protein
MKSRQIGVILASVATLSIVITLLGCGSKGGGGTDPTPTPSPTSTPTPGPNLPTFTRALLNGSLGESGVVVGDGSLAVGSGRPAGGPVPFRTPWSRQAMTWNLAAGNALTNLHPSSQSTSELFGMSPTLFVGWTTDSGGTARATLWNRASANTLKEISGSFTESRVYATQGGFMVGQGRPSGGTLHAIVWDHDASDAPTDLNGSFTSSSAYGVSGPKIVGYGATGGADHAVVWNTATASAAVDINPPGASSSIARGIAGNIVVGAANNHAGFWNLAASNAFTDLTPSLGGTAYVTNGRFVVGALGGTRGFTSLSGELFQGTHAVLWDRDNGNAQIDLQTTYLSDQGFEWSAALGVDSVGNVYGVGGAIVDDFNGNYKAWVLKKN